MTASQTPPRTGQDHPNDGGSDMRARQTRKVALQQAADKLGITLPTIGITPRRWPPFLRTPQGRAKPLPTGRLALIADLAKRRKGTLALGVLASTLSGVSSALIPWAMGRTLDAGLEYGISTQLGVASAIFVLIVAVVALSDATRELTETTMWISSSIGVVPRAVTAHIADNGAHVRAQVPAGDVVTSGEADSINMGRFTGILPDIIANIVVFVAIGALMLQASVRLGMIVLLGLPALFVLLTLLARPLKKRQDAVRDAQGSLTTIATDAVRGLRILRGVGGEESYSRAYREQSQQVRSAAVRVAPGHAGGVHCADRRARRPTGPGRAAHHRPAAGLLRVHDVSASPSLVPGTGAGAGHTRVGCRWSADETLFRRPA